MSETVFNLPGIGPVEESLDRSALSRSATLAELAGLRSFALAAAGRIVRGLAMIAVGAFLLREIPTTPGLTLQMGLLGTLLVAGGIASVYAGLTGPAAPFRAP
ncbi:MAG: hypothetical protein RLZZ326_2505 [Planctomycetota bacterium]